MDQLVSFVAKQLSKLLMPGSCTAKSGLGSSSSGARRSGAVDGAPGDGCTKLRTVLASFTNRRGVRRDAMNRLPGPDWSADPRVAAAHARRAAGPPIQAHADTNGIAPRPRRRRVDSPSRSRPAGPRRSSSPTRTAWSRRLAARSGTRPRPREAPRRPQRRAEDRPVPNPCPAPVRPARERGRARQDAPPGKKCDPDQARNSRQRNGGLSPGRKTDASTGASERPYGGR